MLTEQSDHRFRIEELIDSARWSEAQQAIADLWRCAPGAATAAWILPRIAKLSAHLGFSEHRVAFLRSFTVEPVVPILRASAFASGIALKTYVGEFNAYAQELLETGKLDEFRPDTVILAVQTRDIAPELWEGPEDPAAFNPICERVLADMRSYIAAFRRRRKANIIVHDLELPAHLATGLLDTQSLKGQALTIRQINEGLRSLAAEFSGVFVLAYDDLIARQGRLRWSDERKWLAMRMPFTAESLGYMAQEWLKFIVCLAGKQSKVIVADLDNTLWGGLAGEDGLSGIKLGKDYPGAAYRAVQQALLHCHRRGILLAIASKNNEQDAMEIIDSHPEMLLRRSHFSAWRLNWNNKAHSIREIARELNVGLDAIAFIDDSPFERAAMRSELPEVAVIELPSDAMGYAEAIRACPLLERLTLSLEDSERARYYRQQQERANMARSVASIEDFYRSLAQRIEVATVEDTTVVRVAQLTNKTNQFNLTTRRYTEQQIRHFAGQLGWKVYYASVTDRFGDNGIVAVIITRTEERVCEIDSFLMSCRVIGRTVETALLSFLVQETRAAGMEYLRGRYVRTKKNAPAAN
ncbi:MAG: HAD family hydrolase, partial [Acidobacteriaceae bacterium]|nr:HAD family hydrolase [Acidobacteriaceae bacterium]